MGYDESCSRKLSARNPLIANATSNNREQRSLCSSSSFSSPQCPPRVTPNVFKVDVLCMTLVNDSRRTKYHCPMAILCAYFRWFSSLSLRLAKVPKASLRKHNRSMAQGHSHCLAFHPPSPSAERQARTQSTGSVSSTRTTSRTAFWRSLSSSHASPSAFGTAARPAPTQKTPPTPP